MKERTDRGTLIYGQDRFGLTITKDATPVTGARVAPFVARKSAPQTDEAPTPQEVTEAIAVLMALINPDADERACRAALQNLGFGGGPA
jgi:hypothetical protein